MTKKLSVRDAGVWKQVTHAYTNTKNLVYTGDPHCMFDFDTMDGSIPKDISGNIATSNLRWSGVCVAAAESTRGNIADFTATTNRLSVEYDPGHVNLATTDCTFFAWVWLNPGWTNSNRRIFMLYNMGLSLRLINYNQLQISCVNTAGTYYTFNASSGNELAYNEWIALTLTWEYAAKKARVYVNNSYIGFCALSGTPRSCTAIVYGWDGEALGGYMDDCRFYKSRYSRDGTNGVLKNESLMNGRGVWEEADKVYIKNSSTWKKSHERPYNGNAYIDMTFSSYSQDGITHACNYWNESIQENLKFTLYKNASTLTHRYRGGDNYLGYGIDCPVGGTYGIYSQTFATSIDLPNSDCAISCWSNTENFNGVQRLITLSSDSLVLRYNGNRINCYAFNTAGTYYGFNSVTIPLGWKFLVLNWNHTTKVLTCYQYTGSSRSVTTVTNMGSVTLSGTIRTATSMIISANGSESIEGEIVMLRVHRRQIPISEIPFLAREF